MEKILDEIVLFKQNSIKIGDIYVDPYGISQATNDAKYIFITHSHYDHYSLDDLSMIMNEETIFIMPSSMINDYHYSNKVIFVEPNREYDIDNVHFKTMPMYNLDKPYHPRANNWCGYIINYNNVTYYVMGDTDDIDDVNGIACDVVFIPIGGTYTMDVTGALNCLKKIKYQFVIPVHYGSVVGDISLGNEFQSHVGLSCILKIK